MNGHSLSSDDLAQIAMEALTNKKSVAQIVHEYDIPEWVATDAIVRAVQGLPRLFEVPSDSFRSNKASGTRLRFIHIEKTAGTSLTAWLDNFFHSEEICPDQVHESLVERAKTIDLRRYKLIRGHLFYSWIREFELDDGCSKYMTFLRAPLQRQISFYNHWMYDRTVRDALNPLLYWQNIQTVRLSPLSMRHGYATMRQHLDAAKEALESFFFVGIHERLAESVGTLSSLLGMPTANSLPFLNQTKSNAAEMKVKVLTEADLSRNMKDEVLEANWADVELYAFAVGLFDQKFSKNAPRANDDPLSMEPWIKRAYVELRMDQAVHGTGWWFREGLDGQLPQAWRWTGPTCESQICFHLEESIHFKVAIRVVNSIVPELLDTLRLTVNGVEIETTRRRDGDWGELFEGIVRGTLLNESVPNLVLGITVAETKRFSAVDPSSTDDRMCGIAISEINLHPV